MPSTLKINLPSAFSKWLFTSLFFVSAAVGGSASACAQSHATTPVTPKAVLSGSPQSRSAATAVAEKGETEAAATKNPSDAGIKLHGHWIIDVKNADGTLASHHDFQNSITDNGKKIMLAMLNGQLVPGDYEIGLNSSTGNAPCQGQSLSGCDIVRTTSTNPGLADCGAFYCATTLTKSFSQSGSSSTLTFAGSFTANQAGSINEVFLNVAFCGTYVGPNVNGTTSPSGCVVPNAASGDDTLTQTNPAAIGVNNTQIVQVTVVLTLS